MLRKTDLFAIITIFAVVFCGCLWWQDLERRAAQAGEPVGDVPRLNLAPKVPPREPVKGFCEVRIGAGEYAKRHGYERAKGKMAALPGGYVRVQRGGSEQISVSGACTMKVWINTDVGISDAQYDAYKAGAITLGEFIAGMSAPLVNSATVAGVTLRSYSCYGLNSVAGYGHVMLVVSESPGGQISEEQCDYILDPNPYEVHDYSRWSDPVAVSWSFGPAFLGAKYSCPTPTSGGPAFSYRDGELRHSWFGDENTQVVISGPGGTYTSNPYTTITEIGTWLTGFSISASITTIGQDAAIFTGWTLSGETVDTTGLDSSLGNPLLYGCLKGFGGGEVRANTSYSTTGMTSGSAYADPPVITNYDLNITKFGKHNWTGALLRDSGALTTPHYDGRGNLLAPHYPDGLPMPFQERIVWPMVPWANDTGRVSGILALEHSFTLDGTWMAAQNPPLPASDTRVPIQGPLPNPPALRTDYDAIQLDIAPEIECHRPDGVKLSNYINTDGKITVIEGASETTFLVNATGGTVKRTLARQWDYYFDPTDPDFTFDLCRKTKHVTAEVVPGTGNVTGEDIYGWNTYAYMDLVFRCPVACTVTMAVSAVRYAVLDTYTLPMSERRANYQAIPIDASQSYTFSLEALPGADQTVRVKLLFPDAGGPAYLGRVTAVEFSGFGVGEIILKSQKLVSAVEESGEHAGEYYPYYVKVAPGPPVQRGKYSFVGISHDGSPVVMLTPDTAYKPNEVLDQGGNLRYCEPLTSSVEGVGPLDWQVDIGTVAAWLNALEGVTATHQTAAAESALGDGDAEIGPENADWLIPVYPVTADDSLDRRFVPGTPAMLAARPMCRTLGITNAVEWEIKVDHALMFGIEVQAKTGNEPAPEGVVMQAYYMDGEGKRVDATARGVTDQNGYCVVAPIPADESREYDVEQAA